MFINWCNINQGFLSAILSLLAIIVSGVAIWSSIRATRKQNNIALFEKRLEKYNEIQSFLGKIISNADCTVKEIREYRLQIRDVEFLFDDDIKEYALKIALFGNGLRANNIKYDKLCKSSESTNDNAEKDYKIITWFDKQATTECKKKFNKYLNVKH